MGDQCQLVFYGEVLPGHDAAVARAHLGGLLKLSEAQLDQVFSGRKVVLRKDISGKQADQYVERLAKMGLCVLAEPLGSAPTVASPAATPVMAVAPTAGPPTSAPDVAPTTAEPAIEEMNCPKCGELQPQRTLCRACSVDMKRYAEAQTQVEQEAREERMMAHEIARESAGRGGGNAEVEGILGLGFSGRMGRLNYLMGTLLYWSAFSLLALLLLKLNRLSIVIPLAVLATLIGIRLSVLRCHDLNWSGWWVLVLGIPYVGALLFLVLMIMPGKPQDNAYGEAGPVPSFSASFAIVALFALSLGVFQQQVGALVGYAMNAKSAMPAKGGAAVTAMADADVEIFTATTCGVCHMAMAYMDKRGIRYFEKDVERNEDYLRDFHARGGRGVPYIFVGNESMMGFDADWLERALDGQS